jgi:hypothetical protein
MRGRPGAVAAAVGPGFLDVAVGAGGPAAALQAVSSGRARHRFAATAQPGRRLARRRGRPAVTAEAGLTAGVPARDRRSGRW